MTRPLHPNLARLAAAYDDIFVRWSRGTIDAAQARVEIGALVARDDDGILWSIDPDSGQWLRRTVSGSLIPSEPPTYGLATPTPHDLSNGAGSFNPDAFVHMQPIDDELLHAPSTLVGSTRRTLIADTGRGQRWSGKKILALALVGVVALVAAALVRNGDSDLPAPTAPEVPASDVVRSTP